VVDEVSAMVSEHYPEVDVRGIEPNISVFPLRQIYVVYSLILLYYPDLYVKTGF